MTDGAMLTEILETLEIPCDKYSFHGKLDALAAGLGISTEGRLLGDVLDDIAAKEGIQRDNRLYGAFIRKLYDYVTNGEDVTLTGNPLVLANSMGRPLKECVVSWEPTQEGEGTPSPDNIRPIHGRDSVSITHTGKNIIPYPYKKIEKVGDTYSETGITYTLLSGGAIRINGVSSSIYGMTIARCAFPNPEKLVVSGKIFYDDNNKQTFIYPLKEGESVNEIVHPQIEVGTTATPYEAPMGHRITTLTLPSTIYGGEVNAVTGEGQETWKLLTLDGMEMWGKYGSTTEEAGASCFSLYIDDKDVGFDTSVCNQFANTKNGDPFYNVNMKKFTYTDHPSIKTIYMNYGDDQTVTVDEWKAYLAAQYAAGTPIQIAYKLATPVPFTATGGGPIPTVKGTNTLLTDADTIKATYRCNVHAAEQELDALYTDLLQELEE